MDRACRRIEIRVEDLTEDDFKPARVYYVVVLQAENGRLPTVRQ